jgi:hypothetical protein
MTPSLLVDRLCLHLMSKQLLRWIHEVWLPLLPHPQTGYSRNKVDDVAIQHGDDLMLFAKLRYLLINSGAGGMEGR